MSDPGLLFVAAKDLAHRDLGVTCSLATLVGDSQQGYMEITYDACCPPRILRSVCEEFLTAIHIYAKEARQGQTRYVEASHHCAHWRKGEVELS